MRGIEFRGKREDNGKWVFGSLLSWDAGERHICCEEDDNEAMGKFPVIPETVGEYTGLLDKNGVKIFEGDIVRYKGMELAVRWDTEKAGFFIGNDKYWMMNGTDIEVIGNIHDNPELLNKNIV